MLQLRSEPLRYALLACVALGIGTLVRADTTRVERTDDGIAFNLPAALQPARVHYHTAAAERLGKRAERGFSDGAEQALQLLILREGHQATSLALPSRQVAEEYAASFVRALHATATTLRVYDVQSEYVVERSAFVIRHKSKAASPAKLLIDQPQTGESWARVRQAGIDTRELHCVLTSLLAGQEAADATHLNANISAASQQCSWSDERIREYITQARAAFEPTLTTGVSIEVITTQARVQLLVFAPQAREADVRALANTILGSIQVPREILLRPSIWHELDLTTPAALGRTIGSLLGPVCVVLVIGTLLAWLLGTLGVSPPIAVSAVYAMMIVLVALSAVKRPAFSVFTLMQCASLLLTIALGYGPITRWVNARVRKRAR